MIVAVASRKGGVGKTTTTVNLAAAMAARGRRVLVVDLDPAAGASLSLGVSRSELAPGAASLMLGQDEPPGSLVRATDDPGLDVVPGSVDLRRAESELVLRSDKERVLARGLEPLVAAYDDVFLDCPAGFGILTRNALAAADGYVVPAMPHFLALEGVEQMIEAVARQTARLGVATELLGVVLTMVDYRVRSTRGTLVGIRRRLGARVFAVEVRTNISLAEAPAEGRSIFGYAPRSTGAESYRLLAEELLLLAARRAREREARLAAPVSSAR